MKPSSVEGFCSTRRWTSEGSLQWNAVVAFVPVALRNPLLGQAGFLQFFNADFRGADREVLLTTNPSFPGQRI
jgi:hypothetical protein